MPGTITEAELRSQPDCWQSLIDRAHDFDLRRHLHLDRVDEVVLFGSGTSYYLALAAAEIIESRLGLHTRVLPSCDVFLFGGRYLPTSPDRSLAIGFSRSGESSEAVIAARQLLGRGFPLLAVGCEADSTLMSLAQHRLLVPEGREQAFVMMRSFTSMLLALQLMVLWQADGTIPEVLRSVASHGRAVLAQAPAIQAAASSRNFDRFVFLGSGPDAPLALESALKLQESACVTTEAYRTLEYRHGPRATGGPMTLAVLFDPDVGSYGRDLVRDLEAQGIATMVIAGGGDPYRGEAELVVEIGADLPADLRAPLQLLPVHLLALMTAARLGRDPDRPANLAKVVILADAAA